MKRTRLTGLQYIQPSTDRSQACLIASRLLLVSIGLLLMAMPWTEHFWTWDKFLQGGQDFELGLLAVATVLSLVIVLAQHCKQMVTSVLRTWRHLRILFHDVAQTERILFYSASLGPHAVRGRMLVAYMHNLPLQI